MSMLSKLNYIRFSPDLFLPQFSYHPHVGHSGHTERFSSFIIIVLQESDFMAKAYLQLQTAAHVETFFNS